MNTTNSNRAVACIRFVRRHWPLMTLKAAIDGWWITGADGKRTYLWVHFGPQYSPDGLKIWTLTLAWFALAIGFRGQKPNTEVQPASLASNNNEETDQ